MSAQMLERPWSRLVTVSPRVGEAALDASPAEGTAAPLLRTHELGKQYAGVTVLSGVTLDIFPGEIHAIIGENGAGKSTLMKLLSGHVAPSDGEIFLDARAVSFNGPHQAQDAGIVLVHQEILLADGLTVAENVFLGRELTRHGMVDDRTMHRLAARKLAELGCHASPRALVRDVPLADRQMVQIARALLDEHRIVIFDEPTAVLTGEEVDRLLRIIFRLKSQNIAVLYISHRLEEVQRLGDKVTVLRDGRTVGTYPGHSLSQPDMARLMVGRELSALYPPKTGVRGEPILQVRSANVPRLVHDASFVAHRGEVLGFAGMIGAGRTELFEGLLGLRPAKAQVELDGRSVHIRSMREAIELGIGYLTEDRKGKGLLLQERLAPNLTLSALTRFHPGVWLRQRREAEGLQEAVSTYDIRLKGKSTRAGQLSGGNQQKLLLAKVLLTDPSIVVIDEPTRGIDIANKAQIYAFIRELVARGKACIVISSEMQELIGVCDRVLVMRQGRIVGEVSAERMTEHNIALLATTDGALAADAANPSPIKEDAP
ncbi:sugar ABC transporter ATP-binding protein [Variovorax ginsengisoli]|uniref:Sugar ABC transporter ATP-binding protein n=1 Tax=Variovorax ginsengisoli TaxID=363844 RepID=A0ABT8SF20_9BURK|nr:sugar ABC transporter ATP-binding protein [Variovorax ginsengisoli]MDN8618210.1 sugar ABC transporter ATP-binding protein [Variovorax ginsengisoli]MDO1537380.1 sugar ABC transporter ATP-binding protein [Variovorax ginsengisoli]